jgi:MoaA/NifB/PqqE/SkfB family radical SAM enzyme
MTGYGQGFFPENDMANISITRRCQRHCSYCFAKDELSRDATMDMTPEIYEDALEFLKRSGLREARLLGGEPTEHPLFCEYVGRALELGFRVLVFSGGIVPQSVLEYLAVLPAECFRLVLNATDPGHDAKALVNKHRELCRTLGSKVMLGFNVWSSNEDSSFILDWVSKYNLCPTVRLGMAHPIWGGTNDFFRLRGPRALSVFEHFTMNASAAGLNVRFDCGFTPCMFSQEFVDAHVDLFTSNVRDQSAIAAMSQFKENQFEPIGARCSSVVDILPEGNCIVCYALSRFRRIPLPSKGKRSDLVSYFDRELLPLLPAGVYRECVSCGYREKGMCHGGCRARRAQRLRPNAWIQQNSESTRDA